MYVKLKSFQCTVEIETREKNSIICTVRKIYRFEKRFENKELDCCSGFEPNIGVFGADPRLHAFSYDVSEIQRKSKNTISENNEKLVTS